MSILSIALIMTVLFTLSISFASDDATQASKELQNAGSRIIGALLWFGYAIAIGMVLFIGIKYILGAADAKANMKSAMVNWLIGAFIVFMATTIIGIVFNVIGVSPNTETGGLASEIVNALKKKE